MSGHAKQELERIDAFSSIARSFCELVEAGRPEELALVKALAALHLAALELPSVQVEDDDPGVNHQRPVGEIELPFDLYWELFDPFQTPPDQPGMGSLTDDIADIRLDLRRGLDLHDRGFPLAACWSWRFHYQSHWGRHLVNAQRALHLWMRS